LVNQGDVNPRSLDFGDVCRDSTKDLPITVSNTGNAPLTLNAINSNNGAFTIVSPALPVTIPVGGSVPVTVRYTATNLGTERGALSFNTGGPCGSANLGGVQASGFCVVIDGDVAPRPLNFPPQCVGRSQPQLITVSNTGNRPFTITANSSNAAFAVAPTGAATINPGASRQFTVTFSCTTPGPQSGQISFATSNASNCQFSLDAVNVSGDCQQATGDIEPRQLDFGTVCIGVPAERSFTLSNTGDVQLTVDISPSSPAFAVEPSHVVLPPGASQVVTVRATCGQIGTLTGAINFQANSPCGPVSLTPVAVIASCEQVRIACNVRQRTPFPRVVRPGQNRDAIFELRNTGDRPFTVQEIITIPEETFRVASPQPPFEVTPGPVVLVTLRLVCDSPGSKTGTLTFKGTSICGPFTCGPTGLVGDCPGAAIEVTVPSTVFAPSRDVAQPTEIAQPTELDFSGVKAKSTSTQTLTVRNVGSALLEAAVSTDLDRFEVSPKKFTLEPGAEKELTVTFNAPTLARGVQTDDFTGTLTITSNDPDNPTVNVQLRGVVTRQKKS
jgi:P pilus assembly chaperone PapD